VRRNRPHVCLKYCAVVGGHINVPHVHDGEAEMRQALVAIPPHAASIAKWKSNNINIAEWKIKEKKAHRTYSQTHLSHPRHP
jgi:hypothetical protein